MDDLRCRLQIDRTGRRGTRNDPLYRNRRALKTTRAYLTQRQTARLTELFQDEANKPLEAFWNAYQRIISCYQAEDKTEGGRMMDTLIDELGATPRPDGQPKELTSLARTLNRRRDDILAYFTHPASSNGPTEAINGRLEHLRGIALGFRNLDNYITRSLLHAGGFHQYAHAKLRRASYFRLVPWGLFYFTMKCDGDAVITLCGGTRNTARRSPAGSCAGLQLLSWTIKIRLFTRLTLLTRT